MTTAPIPEARLRHLAKRLHDLGARPVFEYLREILAGRDPIARLEVYACLDPDVVSALGGDQIERFYPVAGGRSR